METHPRAADSVNKLGPTHYRERLAVISSLDGIHEA